jgi:hypothetical protein
MALVKRGTFRLVGTIDAQAVIEELAASEPDDIEVFCVAVIGLHGDRDLAEQIAATLRAMEWVEVEESIEEIDPLQTNIDGGDE